MKQEDKELLLKDLCARLPYGVVIQEKCVEHDKTFLPNKEGDRLVIIDAYAGLLTKNSGSWYCIEDVKPYLFPMSSMTENQKTELDQLFKMSLKALMGGIDYKESDTFEFDFYNKYHLDWRGLIPM